MAVHMMHSILLSIKIGVGEEGISILRNKARERQLRT